MDFVIYLEETLMIVLVSYFVNLIQAKITWEERTTISPLWAAVSWGFSLEGGPGWYKKAEQES